MHKSLLIAPAAAAALAGVLLGPALAAQASGGPTATSFTVNGGSLTLTAPDSSNLGSVTVGTSTVSAQLGDVTVSDQRAQLNGGWTASVISTNFTTGTGTGPETIPAADAAYSPGAVTASSGTGTFTAGTAGALDTTTALTAFTATGEDGATSVTWNPTVTVTLPPSVIAGTYAGTITHSAA